MNNSEVNPTLPVVQALPLAPPKVPLSRAVKNAIHFLGDAARCLRCQSSDPRLHRIADQLLGVIDLLKKADELNGGDR